MRRARRETQRVMKNDFLVTLKTLLISLIRGLRGDMQGSNEVLQLKLRYLYTIQKMSKMILEFPFAFILSFQWQYAKYVISSFV